MGVSWLHLPMLLVASHAPQPRGRAAPALIKVAGPPDGKGRLKIQYGQPAVTLSIHKSLLRPMTAALLTKLQVPTPEPAPAGPPSVFPDGAKDPGQLAWEKKMRECRSLTAGH